MSYSFNVDQMNEYFISEINNLFKKNLTDPTFE